MSIASLALWTAALRLRSPVGTFWLYAGLCAAMFVVVLRVLPETKQKSLEGIQTFWACSGSAVLKSNRKIVTKS